MAEPRTEPARSGRARNRVASHGSPIAAIAIATRAPAPRGVRPRARRDHPGPFTFGEKSDDIARTFVDSGTFGFIPGEPTAYTQPLYSFVLIPLYDDVRPQLGGRRRRPDPARDRDRTGSSTRSGDAGCRAVRSGSSPRSLTALHPYLVWHDVHVNREIVDGCSPAALMLLDARAGVAAVARCWPRRSASCSAWRSSATCA